MTVKEIIKLMLISIGYDRTIEIDNHRSDDGSYYYRVLGINEHGSELLFDGYGFYDLLLDFFSKIKKDKNILNNLNYSINHLSNKTILNDNVRNKIYLDKKKSDDDIRKFLKETKYITEWEIKNNPCMGCVDNKKDHWDSIHYNCSKNHNNTCIKLRNFYDSVTAMYKEYNERKNE